MRSPGGTGETAGPEGSPLLAFGPGHRSVSAETAPNGDGNSDREASIGEPKVPAAALILDGPIILGIAATGRWPALLRLFPELTFVSQNTQAEIREAWIAGVPGGDAINLDELVVLPVADTADPARAIQRGREWRALGETWRATGVSAARAIALAASVVTAIERGIPLVSHDRFAWGLVERQHRARKLPLLGLADLLAPAAIGGRMTPLEAWAAYCEIAIAGPGEQPGWSVSTSERAFMALATQARPALKRKPASS